MINIPHFSIRLLTVFSYFLPFVFFLSTCTSLLEEKNAFNKEDAIKNERLKSAVKLENINNLMSLADTSASLRTAVLIELRSKLETEVYFTDNVNNLSNEFELMFVCPTSYSLSAIGVLCFFKALPVPALLIGLSMLTSLVTIVFWKMIKKTKKPFILLS